MTTAYISDIICRELKTMERELLAYEQQQDIWKIPQGISNSAGTLVLHLCGNLRLFIGAQLGKSGYQRDRAAEFNLRDVEREELLETIKATITEVKSALASVSQEQLQGLYPLEVGGYKVNTLDWLFHLSSHFAYHLGQIDYHRRLVTAQDDTVGALKISELNTARKK